ncbi:MAG TPA: HigA family addiction module antitoxin [Aliidongia sp.]|nr:HigA family addiction module antitoxin [Aliidongia sp.]
MTHIDDDGGEDLEMPTDFIIPTPHPGVTVAAELAARKLSVSRASLMMRMPQSRLARIVACERSITAESALRLGAFFKVSPQFFMNLQTQYDLATESAAHGAQILAEVQAV